MSWQIIGAYLFGLGLIYLFVCIIYYPLKLTSKLILNAIAGVVILFIFNLLGGFFSLTIPINPVTALLVGFLGIPGVILLIVLKFFII